MKNIKRRIITAIYICIFALSLGVTNISNVYALKQSSTAETPAALTEITASDAAMQNKPADFKAVAEDTKMVLYANEKTGEFANLDKTTGMMWYSNPKDRAVDPLANANGKSLMASQFSITYYNSANKSFTYNSYDNCVSRELLTAKNTKNGVIFYYTLTNYVRTDADIPELISAERFNQYFMKGVSTESEKNVLESRFKQIRGGKYYQKYRIPKYELNIIFDIMDRTGYDASQLKKDNDETKSFPEKKEKATVVAKDIVEFEIPLKVEIKDGDVMVSVISNEIKSTKNYYLYSIKLLEFYGAPSTKDTGYLFIPDGSGAIINLNNGKKDSDPAIVSIYGNDNNDDIIKNPTYKEKGLLPVFGINKSGSGMIGIIEQGLTLAKINAQVSGKMTSYNTVCPEFIYQQQGTVNLGNIDQIVFQKSPYKGEFQVRYKFLEKGKSTYSDMAKEYQKYLFAGKEPIKPSNTPIYVDLLGGIEKKKSFFGFGYFADEPLTNYSKVKQIAEELSTKGVKGLSIKYSGWLKGGIRHYSPLNPGLNKALGSSSEFKKLQSKLSEYGATLFPDVSFVEVNQTGNGFNFRSDAAKYISQKPVRLYNYSSVTRTRILENKYLRGIPYKYVLSPNKLDKTVGRFSSWYKQFNVTGLSLNDLGTLVTSDEGDKSLVNRESSLSKALDSYKKLGGYKLMINEGNASVLKYVSDVVNVPLSDSSYNIVDYSVPFYQMVMHGYVNYAGTPINLTDDVEHSFLKAIESGSGLQFKLMYEKSSVLKNTAYTQYFSIKYDNWKDDILKYYNLMDTALGDCFSEKITDHKMIGDGVFATTYENGKKVYVNYNKFIFEKQVDGKMIKINPVSFVVEG